jgi:hypothetical protein
MTGGGARRDGPARPLVPGRLCGRVTAEMRQARSVDRAWAVNPYRTDGVIDGT